MRKLQIPSGSITIRHRRARNVFQCFAGKTYVTGASGDTVDEVIAELKYHYDVKDGTPAKVYGYREMKEILI